MINHYLHIDFTPQRGLQEQLRERLIDAIFSGVFPASERLPSCRQMASQLSISRNTVSLVYEELLRDGYLISRPRSGYYLHPDYHIVDGIAGAALRQTPAAAPDWAARVRRPPSSLRMVTKPARWMDYPYPFVYGQPNTQLFPITQWRHIARRLTEAQRVDDWLYDDIDRDVPLLVQQIIQRVLPKRGIVARPDEILVTLGTQNALSLIAQLLFDADTHIGVENPVFREAANVFALQGSTITTHTLDEEGIQLDARMATCDYLYVTPGHQSPTGIRMSDARRDQLLAHARQHDQIIIEDDYDSDIHFDPHPHAALKARDSDQRVIYVSSLSKTLTPGMRLGYLVAPAELVEELRALRRLSYRHPPTPIQHQMAHFLAQGYYDRYLHTYRQDSMQRWQRMNDALNHWLPECRRAAGSEHANAFWLELPPSTDIDQLAWRAAQLGVLIEPGQAHFWGDPAPNNFLRLGFHSIEKERIEEGIQRLATAFHL